MWKKSFHKRVDDFPSGVSKIATRYVTKVSDDIIMNNGSVGGLKDMWDTKGEKSRRRIKVMGWE